MATQLHTQHPQPVRLPDLFKLASLAIEYGEVEGLTGLRHFSDPVPLGWDQKQGSDSRTPVFHAYGFGGAGLTMAPAIAEFISQQLCPHVIKPSPIHTKHEIIIVGAGYTGVFAALRLRKDLNNRERQDISIRIISSSLPRGCSQVIPHGREPSLADNYPSQIAGGIVMPFNIGQMPHPEQWPTLLLRTQQLWERYSQHPSLATAIQKKQAIVLPAHQGAGYARTETIDSINQLYPETLFPKHQGPDLVKPDSDTGTVLNSIIYDNLVQVETSSVLLHFLKKVIAQNITITQLDKPLSSYQELQQHFSSNTKTCILNASGHGAEAVFRCPTSSSIRGDLLVLKIPLCLIPEDMQHIQQYCYLSNACYLLVRKEVERPWVHFVLGGSCIENDSDLTLHGNILCDILNYWFDLLHSPDHNSAGEGYSEKKEQMIDALMEAMTSP